jgi:hypothetical protein
VAFAQPEQPGTQTIYIPDYAKINQTFHGEAPVNGLRDLFSVNMKFKDPMNPERTLSYKAQTHVFGKKMKITGYGAAEMATDAAGNSLPYDVEVAKSVKPGDVYIYVKGHRPEHRFIDTRDPRAADPNAMKEHFKLQNTHISIAVGVKHANGKAGAITLNNPQSYQNGRFGSKTYGGIFVKPVMPKYLTGRQQKGFMNNIRNMIAGFNAVSDFPGDYNGGDPLGVHNPKEVRKAVANMILAIAGKGASARSADVQSGSVAAKARQWFKDPKNQIYCAELAFVGMSAGMIVPLNWSGVKNLKGIGGQKIDQQTWGRFQQAMKAHNRGETTPFTALNGNSLAKKVMLAPEKGTLGQRGSVSALPSDLKPEYAYGRTDARAKLALKPQTMAGIVEGFLATHVPRSRAAGVDKAIQSMTGKNPYQMKAEARAQGQQLGVGKIREMYMAPIQAALLQNMKPGLYGQMDLIDKPGDTAGNAIRAQKRAQVDVVWNALVEKVKTPHKDYRSFRKALRPVLAQAKQITGPRPDAFQGKGLFVPPSLFHLAAKFRTRYAGSLDFKYHSHGLEFSMLRPKVVRARTRTRAPRAAQPRPAQPRPARPTR